MIKSWLQAARLPSQSYIALPLVLGQVLAFQVTGEWDWQIFVLVQLFGVFDQLYIVFANDYADQETDKTNTTSTIFSGGSRVLVSGAISANQLLRAALLMVLLAVCTLTALSALSNTLILPIGLFGMALLWAYSFGPIRLSYRGGGEFLQMLGVGLILPLIGFLSQGALLGDFPWPLLATLLPFNLATAIATSLPDEPSDRSSDKRTLTVAFGGKVGRALIIIFYILGGIAYLLNDGPWPHLVLTLLSCVAMLLVFRAAQPGSRAILVFVFFAILANLGFLLSLILHLTAYA